MELIEGQGEEPGPHRIGCVTSSPEECDGSGVRAHCGKLPPQYFAIRPPRQVWRLGGSPD